MLEHHTAHLLHAIDKEMEQDLGRNITNIIQEHAVLCVGAGLIPVPFLDTAGAAAKSPSGKLTNRWNRL